MLPEPPPPGEFKPKLDKTLRLRAIRRIDSAQKAEVEAAAAPKKKPRAKKKS